LGLGYWSRHGHLLNIIEILAIDEIHRVGVDDSGVIRLALDFEIVRDEVNGASLILHMGRFEG